MYKYLIFFYVRLNIIITRGQFQHPYFHLKDTTSVHGKSSRNSGSCPHESRVLVEEQRVPVLQFFDWSLQMIWDVFEEDELKRREHRFGEAFFKRGEPVK